MKIGLESGGLSPQSEMKKRRDRCDLPPYPQDADD